MTLQELEQAMELHERRMARVEDNLAAIAAMAEGHEQRMARIEDNLTVQGEFLNRLDQRLDRMAAAQEKNTENMRVMQSAMTALFERMDAFIRGLEGRNGHQHPGKL